MLRCRCRRSPISSPGRRTGAAAWHGTSVGSRGARCDRRRRGVLDVLARSRMMWPNASRPSCLRQADPPRAPSDRTDRVALCSQGADRPRAAPRRLGRIRRPVYLTASRYRHQIEQPCQPTVQHDGSTWLVEAFRSQVAASAGEPRGVRSGARRLAASDGVAELQQWRDGRVARSGYLLRAPPGRRVQRSRVSAGEQPGSCSNPWLIEGED